MSERAFTGNTVDKKAIVYVALGAVSLLLWFLPVVLGQPLPFDWAFAAAWLAFMGVMLVNLRLRDAKKRTLMHTVYFDERAQRGFSPYLGSFPCKGSQELIDRLIVMFAEMAGADSQKPNFNAPEDFNPSLILETSNFTFRRDEGVKVTAPVCGADDVTVEDWSGRIVDASTGKHRPFRSLFELEEAF